MHSKQRLVTASLSVSVVLSATCGAALAAPRPAASDATIAQQLVVTQADVGPGYTAKPSPPHDPDQNRALFAQCLGKPAPKRIITAFEAGPTVTPANPLDTIDSNAVIVKTKAMAQADNKLFNGPGSADCGKRFNQQAWAPDVVASFTQHGPAATVLGPKLRPYLDRATDVKIGMKGPNGSAVPLANGHFIHTFNVSLRKGRAEVFVLAISSDSGTPTPELQATLHKLYLRLKKAKV